jgi:hypothetical protein
VGALCGCEIARTLDLYRAKAEQCRQLATLTPKADDKAFWLGVAENWARLAELVADIGRPTHRPLGDELLPPACPVDVPTRVATGTLGELVQPASARWSPMSGTFPLSIDAARI